MKNQKVLLLHGWGGSDFPHWQSFLASELAKNYGSVSFLKFSDFDFPKKDIWIKELQDELKSFKPTVVICHSLANTLWFHLCNMGIVQEVQNLFLVAPPSLTCSVEELKDFFPVEVPKKLYAKQSMLIGSSDDPYMKQDELENLQKSLDVDLKILDSAGHINSDSGYGEWLWMLKKIKGLRSE